EPPSPPVASVAGGSSFAGSAGAGGGAGGGSGAAATARGSVEPPEGPGTRPPKSAAAAPPATTRMPRAANRPARLFASAFGAPTTGRCGRATGSGAGAGTFFGIGMNFEGSGGGGSGRSRKITRMPVVSGSGMEGSVACVCRFSASSISRSTSDSRALAAEGFHPGSGSVAERDSVRADARAPAPAPPFAWVSSFAGCASDRLDGARPSTAGVDSPLRAIGGGGGRLRWSSGSPAMGAQSGRPAGQQRESGPMTPRDQRSLRSSKETGPTCWPSMATYHSMEVGSSPASGASGAGRSMLSKAAPSSASRPSPSSWAATAWPQCGHTPPAGEAVSTPWQRSQRRSIDGLEKNGAFRASIAHGKRRYLTEARQKGSRIDLECDDPEVARNLHGGPGRRRAGEQLDLVVAGLHRALREDQPRGRIPAVLEVEGQEREPRGRTVHPELELHPRGGGSPRGDLVPTGRLAQEEEIRRLVDGDRVAGDDRPRRAQGVGARGRGPEQIEAEEPILAARPLGSPGTLGTARPLRTDGTHRPLRPHGARRTHRSRLAG